MKRYFENSLDNDKCLFYIDELNCNDLDINEAQELYSDKMSVDSDGQVFFIMTIEELREFLDNTNIESDNIIIYEYDNEKGEKIEDNYSFIYDAEKMTESLFLKNRKSFIRNQKLFERCLLGHELPLLKEIHEMRPVAQSKSGMIVQVLGTEDLVTYRHLNVSSLENCSAKDYQYEILSKINTIKFIIDNPTLLKAVTTQSIDESEEMVKKVFKLYNKAYENESESNKSKLINPSGAYDEFTNLCDVLKKRVFEKDDVHSETYVQIELREYFNKLGEIAHKVAKPKDYFRYDILLSNYLKDPNNKDTRESLLSYIKDDLTFDYLDYIDENKENKDNEDNENEDNEDNENEDKKNENEDKKNENKENENIFNKVINELEYDHRLQKDSSLKKK